MNWNVVLGIVSVLMGIANSYLILRLKFERAQTQNELLEFEKRLMVTLEEKFVGRNNWKHLEEQLDATTDMLKTEIQRNRDQYHELVNKLISETVQTVSASLRKASLKP